MAKSKTVFRISGMTIFLVFLILKVTEVAPFVDWSWWWITAPLWIPLGITILVILFLLLIATIVAIANK